MSKVGSNDLRFLLNGIRRVLVTNVELRKAECETKIANSSLKGLAEQLPNVTKSIIPDNPADLLKRVSVVHKGVHQFVTTVASNVLKQPPWSNQTGTKKNTSKEKIGHQTDLDDDVLFIREEDLESTFIKSLGVELMQPNQDGKDFMKQFESLSPTPATPIDLNILDKQMSSLPPHEPKLHKMEGTEKSAPKLKKSEPVKPKPLSKNKPNSQLGASSKARKVPASRLSRLTSYGGLAVGLGIGALTEITKRSLGLAKQDPESSSLLDSSAFLSEANAERIVDTLCRVRGAALKIGQILSIQDNSMINPELQKVFERVRHSADFMPAWQMEKVMVAEFGPEWTSKLAEFDRKPFAAASIGQVHLGKLHDGRPVAVKIQYPGVAQGIESDIDNLVSVFSIWNILPDGIFADKIIEVAKRELRWEVDYLRESQCAKRFRKLLINLPDYYVPEVIDDLTTKQIYTTELIEGLTVDKFETLDQETRNRISYLLLDLFFREIFEFRFMQTDPNWSNFLYNADTRQIGLLDFGSAREFRKEFVDNYVQILKGAATNDIPHVLKYSRDIGFLTGYESKSMEKAHVDTVMILGEAFRIGDNPYDFGKQEITRRIQELVPVMVKERLCPPPEEIYSLHRKLSGVFLLCAKLRGKVKCRPIFDRVWNEYKFGPEEPTHSNQPSSSSS